MFCKYCGKEMKNTAAFCSACGNAAAGSQGGGIQQAITYEQPLAADQAWDQDLQDGYASYEAAVPQQKPNGYAIASLVLALGGISCFMPVIGGVLAIALGRVSMKIALRKHEPTGMATVGIALGVVSFIVNLIVVLAI